jgi:NAD(P)-dependent dehydrogenase (short-subunit alcohol dehydrogenase family)
MALDLSGKRAIITAAGGGIGRQTVKLFSEAGAKIFICDIDEDGLHSTISGHDNVDGMIVDVSDPEAMADFFTRADAYLGGLDFMVNNAGTAGPTAPIEEVTLDDWRACLTVNLTSAFLGTQHAIPRIKEAGGGGIVNLSSAAGKFGFALRSPYVASKWAIVGLTRTTALEVGPFGIRCNCIQPGPVEGERINRVIRAKAEAEGASENQTRDEMVSITSLRSFVPPTHISGMILYLCSDLGATITGQAISVDSGLEGMGG